ncbi:MAG TPA: hypothetical protein VFX84_02810 [Candidatus Saccharimonadales bacterium]|nr:hypothetical protein [Candidatus Saccharimonadales bacterium]
MGAEQIEPAGEDDGGSAAAADAASCIVRRFVIDPSRRVLIDVPGRTVRSLGSEAVDAGLAGAGRAVDIGRKVVGAEAPEPAAEAVEP